LERFWARRQKLRAPGQWLAQVPKAELKKLVRKGIPSEHRAEVWWSILKCDERWKKKPNAYSQYLSEHLDPKALEVIDGDLMRTFPDHRKFSTVEGRTELRNVLRAFARHAPEVQYVQGMNFIAALFLLVLEDEERAFWALLCAMETLDVEGYYTDGMELLRADMKVLGMLLEAHCSRTFKQLALLDIDIVTICDKWHLTWFAVCLPIATLLRVWDVLFFEGFKVLFRISIGIFFRVEANLLQCGSAEEILMQCKNWPRDQIEHNELLKAAFNIKAFRRRDIAAFRDRALQELFNEDQIKKRNIEEKRAARERAKTRKQGEGSST